MIEFDNVFKARLTKEYVEIYAGRCDASLLQGEGTEVADEQVKDIKILRFEIAKYRNFLGLAIALGMGLQNDYGIDLGLEIEEKQDGENDE